MKEASAFVCGLALGAIIVTALNQQLYFEWLRTLRENNSLWEQQDKIVRMDGELTRRLLFLGDTLETKRIRRIVAER